MIITLHYSEHQSLLLSYTCLNPNEQVVKTTYLQKIHLSTKIRSIKMITMMMSHEDECNYG